MKKFFARFCRENDGVLSFEWVTLNSIVVLGVVGGVASVRDAINDEMADMTEAITSLDQSYSIVHPCGVAVHRTSTGGGPQININEGAGYSSLAWKDFLNRNPNYSSAQYRGTKFMTASGAASSRYMDKKPKIERNMEPGVMTPEPVDESGMIDNQQ